MLFEKSQRPLIPRYSKSSLTRSYNPPNKREIKIKSQFFY